MTVNEIVTYVMSNPANTNYSVARAMLEELLGDNPNVDTVLDYVVMTPANTNYSVLKMWLEVLKGETPSPTPDPDPDPEPEPGPEPDPDPDPTPSTATLTLYNVDNPSPNYGIISIAYGDNITEMVHGGTQTYDLAVNDEFTLAYAPGDQFTARYGLYPDAGVQQVERISSSQIKFKIIAATGGIIYKNETGDDVNPDPQTS